MRTMSSLAAGRRTQPQPQLQNPHPPTHTQGEVLLAYDEAIGRRAAVDEFRARAEARFTWEEVEQRAGAAAHKGSVRLVRMALRSTCCIDA